MEDNASASSLQWDMLDLADRLRQERLFVSAEQEHLKELNAKVVSVSSRLARMAWIMVQQRANLNRLILARPDCPPSVCCQRAVALECTQFIDGDKELPFQDCVSFGEFMQTLRTSPHLLAACLAAGDRLMPEAMPTVINTLYGGLFGSCLLPEDKLLALRLLRHLTQIQLVPSENPRRMLRHGSCALARMYGVFHEGLFSAKIFLTAALHDPIMQLLMRVEFFLDIDPDKAVVRFPPDERLKKFGEEGTPDYASKLQQYRRSTVSNLVVLVQRFVISLRENMHCFPTSIRWLVRQISGMLNKSGQLEPKEVFDICVDLIFSFLICPAIVNPEQHGITDAPVSYIARHNLMQVAQILQVLATRKYHDVDPKVWDLYSQFDKDILSSLVDGLLEGAANGLLEEPVISESSKLQGLSRSAALMTESELYGLVNFLQLVQASTGPDAAGSVAAGLFDEAGVDRKLLAALLAQLPPTAIAAAASFAQSTSNMNGNMSSPPGVSAQGPSPSGSSSKQNNLSPPHAANGSSPDTPNRKSSIIGKGVAVAMSKTSKAIRSVAGSGDSIDENPGNEGSEEGLDVPKYSVLVIPFSPDRGQYVGLLPEQKVLNIDCEAQKNTPSGSASHLSVAGTSSIRAPGIPPERSESLEKRTRFSLSHDEGSIGNTSDNLEAVSEAASNHSVASSLELENEDQDQNDNLSDMVSANVSGRGTPNISGRDTPSSQITEGDEGARNVAIEPRPNYDLPPPPPPTKQSRSDIDDKFGKFEIKKLLEGDETTSLVSDTWSTDVLASDSELIEQSERERERERERNYAQQPPLLPLSLQPPLVPLPGILPGPPGSAQQSLIDMSETASEAWSTDVLASDSERMLEIDTDDTSSVARSDDTARSEVESRGEPEGGDDTPPLSSAGAAVFRPIRDEGRPASVSSLASSASGMVPPSPTRSDNIAHHSWNVTGRGGGRADYRRRTLEYIDNNARAQAAAISRPTPLPITHEETRIPPIGRSQSVPVSPPLSAVSDPTTASPLLHPEPSSTPLNPLSVSTSSLIPVPSNVAPSASNASMLSGPSEALIDIDRGDEAASQIVSHASTASLASSSSSGGGASGGASGSGGSSSADLKPPQPPPPALTSTPTPDLPAPAPVLANGSVCGIGAVPRSGIATGAIPKSISFDKTAERGDKELLDDDQKHKRGFFRNFKLPFNKNRRGKSLNRSGDDMGRYDSLDGEGPHLRVRRGPNDEEKAAYTESSEDILAKYRRKPSSGADSAASESSGRVPVSAASLSERDVEQGADDERLFIDPNNVEASYAFKDAKRKLRMVLSTADLQHVPWRSQCPNKVDDPLLKKENELIAFLKMQLAEAINLQDRALAAHLHETLRCIKLFNNDGCQKLFHSLKEDYRQRTPYTAYLVRCRQGLLSTLAHLERMIERLKCEGAVCNRCLVSVCVRMFLERREGQVNDFTVEFQQLTLADEKTDLLENFLLTLAADMERDPFWAGVNNDQLLQSRTAIEQAIISRVYPYALYPNGEGDMLRDQLLHEHLKKLSEIITPNHKDNEIAKMFHYECPWPSAQAEIASISAYKTAKDKLQCVSRCATTIMNLLKMVQERNVPAADDFIPVLVFVLIKANPPALLSTVQYVNTFYGSRLEGEEHYWWTQFCGAIEYIKTLDYRD